VSKHLQRDIALLRTELLSQFGVVERMVERAVESLVDRRVDQAADVIATDEAVDSREVKIEEECLKMFALHGPVASDLRWLVTVVKINSDLERIGDLACNIAERAQALNLFPLFPIPDDLTLMVREASAMFRQAVDAFIEQDIVLAQHVIKSDDRVDALNRDVIEQLQTLMNDDPEQIVPALHCFSAARNIERVADLAENLAEEVIYMVAGEIVRHKHGDFNPPPR
jgi:phosphate transport system protein